MAAPEDVEFLQHIHGMHRGQMVENQFDRFRTYLQALLVGIIGLPLSEEDRVSQLQAEAQGWTCAGDIFKPELSVAWHSLGIISA